MTPQESLDQEGFLSFSANRELPLGSIVHNFDSRSFVKSDVALVVIGRLSSEEARAWCNRTGHLLVPARFHYKVIAE